MTERMIASLAAWRRRVLWELALVRAEYVTGTHAVKAGMAVCNVLIARKIAGGDGRDTQSPSRIPFEDDIVVRMSHG